MQPSGFDPSAVTRPAPVLLRYYLVIALFSTVAFPAVFLPLYFRYHTLRFRFDGEGISISWGILFRREVHLTYRRIQDIHVTRNLLQRWMGLATVQIQTASGNASAEIKVEGVLEADALRDFLYSKMRGAREEEEEVPGPPADSADEVLTLLREIRDGVRGLRP
jgi:uncharacterized membrane protein YdbT with pleckstrin-like domain